MRVTHALFNLAIVSIAGCVAAAQQTVDIDLATAWVDHTDNGGRIYTASSAGGIVLRTENKRWHVWWYQPFTWPSGLQSGDVGSLSFGLRVTNPGESFLGTRTPDIVVPNQADLCQLNVYVTGLGQIFSQYMQPSDVPLTVVPNSFTVSDSMDTSVPGQLYFEQNCDIYLDSRRADFEISTLRLTVDLLPRTTSTTSSTYTSTTETSTLTSSTETSTTSTQSSETSTVSTETSTTGTSSTVASTSDTSTTATSTENTSSSEISTTQSSTTKLPTLSESSETSMSTTSTETSTTASSTDIPATEISTSTEGIETSSASSEEVIEISKTPAESTSTILSTSATSAPAASSTLSYTTHTTSSATPSRNLLSDPASNLQPVGRSCVGSLNGYTNFLLVDSSPDMDLDLCASLCMTSGKPFMGAYDTDCYCGDSTVRGDYTDVPEERCNIPCPGNPSQRCGGLSGVDDTGRRDLQARQSPPVSVFLSVWVLIISDGTVTTSTTIVAGPSTSTSTPSIPNTSLLSSATTSPGMSITISSVIPTSVGMPSGTGVPSNIILSAARNDAPVSSDPQTYTTVVTTITTVNGTILPTTIVIVVVATGVAGNTMEEPGIAMKGPGIDMEGPGIAMAEADNPDWWSCQTAFCDWDVVIVKPYACRNGCDDDRTYYELLCDDCRPGEEHWVPVSCKNGGCREKNIHVTETCRGGFCGDYPVVKEEACGVCRRGATYRPQPRRGSGVEISFGGNDKSLGRRSTGFYSSEVNHLDGRNARLSAEEDGSPVIVSGTYLSVVDEVFLMTMGLIAVYLM